MSVVSYDTGTATNLANLVTSIQAKLSANGWASAGSSLSKGSISVSITTTASGAAEILKAKATVNGEAAPGNSYMLAGGFSGQTDGSLRNITWPASYHIFVYDNPDLVVIALNHDSVYWQYLMFGEATNLGSTGFGGHVYFQWSTFHAPSIGGNRVTLVGSSGLTPGQQFHPAYPFLFQSSDQVSSEGQSGYAYLNEGVGFERTAANPAFTWAPHLYSSPEKFGGQLTTSQLFPAGVLSILLRQPNAWNGDSVFTPIRVGMERPDGFWSWMFEIPHIRMARNDYYADLDEVDKGSDKWLVTSCRRKNLADRDGMIGTADSSGTFAFTLLKADS